MTFLRGRPSLVAFVAFGVSICPGAIGRGQIPDDPATVFPYPKIFTSKDPEKMRGKLQGKDTTFDFRLLNVLPFSKWPTNLSREQQKIRADAQELFANLQKDDSEVRNGWLLVAAAVPKSEGLAGDLYHWHGEWAGKAPAEKVGRGLLHVNIWMVQEGLTVYQRPPKAVKISFATSLIERDNLFLQAEKHAIANKKGIWRDNELATRLKRLANPEDKE